jgi:predicted NAD/FAD-binding protein
MKIAIIGSGIAGNSAGWLLNQHHEITIYEQSGHIGGHCNTVDVPSRYGGPATPIDIGFIVHNKANYPNLCALFDHVGVLTRSSNMSFSVSLDGGRLEYAGTSPFALFAQRRNLLRPAHWRMLREIVRFCHNAPGLLADPVRAGLTLGQYLKEEGYGGAFVHDHLLPMGAAIWSSPPAAMLNFPAISFIRFFHNHGLLKLTGRPDWRIVVGGSRTYVDRLTMGFAHRVRKNRPVTAILRSHDGVEVRDALGGRQRFVHVVVATHADQALALLGDPSPDETSILGAFRYQSNRVILHRDAALMPKRKRVWASWNYLGNGLQGARSAVSLTYWMNLIHDMDERDPLFVTLNPAVEPSADGKIGEAIFDHPVFDMPALSAQAGLGRIQGNRRTWFCGAWCGYGFHEDGLSAGLAVAEALGCQRPWNVPDVSPAGRNVRPSTPLGVDAQ